MWIFFNDLAIGDGKFDISSDNGPANHSLNRMFGKTKVTRIDFYPDRDN